MKKALVLSLALVLGLGVASFAQTLSGSWNTTISIVPTPVELSLKSELIVTYAVSGWSFSSDTVLTDAGWTKQHFDVSGALGAFTLGSTLTFDPTTVAFTKWVVTGGLSLAGVTFNGTFTLTPGVTTLKLVGSGTAGNVDVKTTIGLGSGEGCNFDFNYVTIDVGFPFCCADVASQIKFNCNGFIQASFEVDGIAIPNLPWLALDAKITFQTGSKVLALSPSFDFGAVACFDLYITQATSEEPYLSFGDIIIEGIGLSCEIGGVEFSGISWWGEEPSSGLPGGYPDDLKPGILNGMPYWEAYQIKTTDDGCCGPFSFDITVFFGDGSDVPFVESGELFGIGEVDANMSIQVATQFTFSMGIVIDLTATPSFTSWTLGFLVEW